MGAWGYGLFESDSDLEVLAEITSDLGQLIDDEHIQLYYPPHPQRVAEKLNEGAFHQLLTDYSAQGWKHGVILLGAVMMQLGGLISTDDLALLRTTIKDTPMTHQAKEQMCRATDGYTNDGRRWKFGSRSLRVAMMHFSARTGHKKDFCSDEETLRAGVQVPQDPSTMAQPKPTGDSEQVMEHY
ncbi:MAG: hypothetical protein LQ346_005026 [Caloplaca aetnensis]|nr:MAG: hypothetical protein LQ346_005026 [Caloplaca aetnensis]